jgi:hypothetical protein
VNIDTIADKLELRAIREGWPITTEMRRQIIERAMDRASCGDPDIEDKAAKIFLAADAVNLKRQQLEQKKLDAEHARKLKLIEAAIRLGIVSDGRAAIGGTVISAPEC